MSPLSRQIERLTVALDGAGDRRAAWRSVCNELLSVLASHPALSLMADPCAMFALAEFLDRLAGPGRNGLLLDVADTLLARGVRDPIVAASAAQALCDLGSDGGSAQSGGPAIALDVLARQVDFAGPPTAHLSAALGMKGRAHKDLYAHALAANLDDLAASHGAAAVAAYLEAARTLDKADAGDDPRCWLWRYPAINAITVAHDMRRRGLAAASETSTDTLMGEVREVAMRLRARFNGKTTTLLDADPQNHSTLAELAVLIDADNDRALAHLDDYGAALRAQPGTPSAQKLNSTLRQWTRFIHTEDPRLRAALTGMAHALLQLSPSGLTLDEETVRNVAATAAEADKSAFATARRMAEAYFGDGEMADLRLLFDAVRLASGVVAIREREPRARTVGTGFLIDANDFRGGDGAPDFVILTNAHVVGWAPRAGDHLMPENVEVRFELIDGQPTVGVDKAASGGGDPEWALARDFTLLRLKGDVPAAAQPVPLRFDTDLRQGQAYVIGHPAGGALAMAVGRNAIEAPPATFKDGADMICYGTRTDGGHSGSPVLVATGGGRLKAVALHVGNFTRGTSGANFGVWLATIRRELARLPTPHQVPAALSATATSLPTSAPSTTSDTL